MEVCGSQLVNYSDMDGTDAAVKRRRLPPWMTDETSGPKKPRSAEPRRRKAQVCSVSSRRRTVYCMNEQEVVESALEVLSQSKVQREGEKKSKAEEDTKEASPETGREKKPPTSAGSEEPRNRPPSCNDSDDPDNDPLKYVREIFFS
ncbi:cell cycle regulator of non-homologous end joining [Phyllobates terribilis]|uniref:cell cycle regulator of non-homologous end joining n=1 Tax=Phyllobates terribilis TaxID=111132 RepID=UPI003CCB3D3F